MVPTTCGKSPVQSLWSDAHHLLRSYHEGLPRASSLSAPVVGCHHLHLSIGQGGDRCVSGRLAGVLSSALRHTTSAIYPATDHPSRRRLRALRARSHMGAETHHPPPTTRHRERGRRHPLFRPSELSR